MRKGELFVLGIVIALTALSLITALWTATPSGMSSLNLFSSPDPSSTPGDTGSPIPTETSIPTEPPVPTETPVSTETPVPTESPIPTETPTPTPTTSPVPVTGNCRCALGCTNPLDDTPWYRIGQVLKCACNKADDCTLYCQIFEYETELKTGLKCNIHDLHCQKNIKCPEPTESECIMDYDGECSQKGCLSGPNGQVQVGDPGTLGCKPNEVCCTPRIDKCFCTFDCRDASEAGGNHVIAIYNNKEAPGCPCVGNEFDATEACWHACDEYKEEVESELQSEVPEAEVKCYATDLVECKDTNTC